MFYIGIQEQNSRQSGCASNEQGMEGQEQGWYSIQLILSTTQSTLNALGCQSLWAFKSMSFNLKSHSVKSACLDLDKMEYTNNTLFSNYEISSRYIGGLQSFDVEIRPYA